ncbi:MULTISPECIES: beta-ketoacyl-ACP synthase III [Paenibacillus]|uniref:beta-ketoacyl-ACP synthase III n=1 Tax=Paenibacillus TaxID=44249 RepID=UPI00203E2068|nr:beta-ketoacyl-ACP synthase III [Paenibacillus camelliae]MCM3632076.1 ketoacyl-ACP synthase III [Paenibacillus camelliae]
MNSKSVGILGAGKYVPEQVLTNQQLEQMVDTNDEWIVTRTGIKERRIAASDEATSDLAYKAAEQALHNAGLTAKDIDLIIVATVTPDMFFPSTACLVQEKLGATCPAFDLSAACSGFIYSLATANGFVQSGLYRKILVIGAETLSRITDYTDRNTCILFGDGAGAVVVGEVEEGRGFQSFVLGADGSGGELLKVAGGGSRKPATAETISNNEHSIHMAGNEVFKFAVRIMGSAAEEAIEKAGISKADVDLLVPHQANIRIIQSSLQRLDLTEDKALINIDKYGNMSAASIPVALAEAVEQNRIGEGDTLCLVGFGGGLTWGSTIIKW